MTCETVVSACTFHLLTHVFLYIACTIGLDESQPDSDDDDNTNKFTIEVEMVKKTGKPYRIIHGGSRVYV